LTILRLILGVLSVSLLGTPGVSSAAVTQISPSAGSCNEEFENVANTLQPGDELVLREGTYSQSCRRAITVNGTAAAAVLIRAAGRQHRHTEQHRDRELLLRTSMVEMD
jgi:hypothetical protein